MNKQFTLLLSFLIICTSAFGQAVTQIESFESTTIFPAPGWRTSKYVTNVNGAFVLQAAATATNPICGASPGGGLNVMMLNSWSSTTNDTSIMITKPFDFSNNAGVNPSFSFYMFRDNGVSINNDHIKVYINTSPSIAGATLLTHTLGSNKLPRYFNSAPVALANTWNQYTYNLTAASYTAKRYYFIIMGVSKSGNNIYLDQVTTQTYPSATLASNVSMNVFLQNVNAVGVGTTNNYVIGMRCIVAGTSGCGVVNGALSTAVKIDSLLLNTNGTTNLANIANAKIYYTGGSVLFDTSYVSPFPATAGSDDYPSRRFGTTIATPGTNLDFMNSVTSCSYLEYDTTYFWLTYDVKSTAPQGNLLDASLRSFSVGGTAGSCPSPGGTGISVLPSAGGFSLPGAAMIDLPYCVGVYTTGTSGLNNSYTNNDFVQSVNISGAFGTSINTTLGATNNNSGLPSNLPCLVSNGGAGCDFTSHPPDYELWNPIPGRTVTLTQGTSYNIALQAGTWTNNNNLAAFIDYNHDGDFSDAGEKLGQVTCNANQILNFNFTVPAVGYTGITRMRVREVFANANIDPCATYTNGEIEDFYISIAPNCPSTYKLWLGNTDEWNNTINWCGGIPAITDNAVIDRAQVFPTSGIPTRPYFAPVIKSNVLANAKNLTISTLDSLLINAATPSSNALKIRQTMTNNGSFIVNSNYTNNVTYGNGTLQNTVYTPFKAQSTDARTQIIYTAAELSASGLIAGDNINGLEFNIWFKGSLSAYNGFTVSYALVPFNQHANNVPFAGALTTVFGPLAYTTVAGVNTINLSNPIVWNGTSNLLIQYCFDNASNIGSNDDRILITQTTGLKSTLVLSSTINVNSGCTLIPGAGVTDNFFAGQNSYRPNFTFLLNRPFGKALITVQKDWTNNGIFTAGYSRVIMDSTVAQKISGLQSTTFSELQINKNTTAQKVTMFNNVSIDTSLILSRGQLIMNAFTLTMNNSAVSGGNLNAPTGPFLRTNGFLISENAVSSVIWKNINTTFGYRVVPFGSEAISAPIYIPFSFTHKSGSLGDVNIATYKAISNLPWPPTVTHINNAATGVNNAVNMADRYWMLSKTGANPVTDIIFRFTATERPVGMSAFNQGKAQPFRTTMNSNSWTRLFSPYTTLTYTQNYGQLAAAFDSVRVINWDWPNMPQGPAPVNDPAGPIGNSHPWTITLNSNPCGYGNISPLQITVTSKTNESCSGSANGAINISVTGGSAPYSYVWNGGVSTEDRSNLTAGTYTVTVTDMNGSTAAKTIVVNAGNQSPAALGSINGPNSVCNGGSFTFIVPLSNGATNYQWTAPANSNISSGQGSNSVVVNFNSNFAGGNLCVIASNTCGSTTASCLSITGFSGSPATPSAISGTASGVCGSTKTYSVTNVVGLSYLWSVPAGATILSGQGTKSISVQFTNSFVSGAILVVASNACGNSNARTKTVYGKPSKPLVITGPIAFCNTDTVVYSTAAVTGNNTYLWTVPSGLVIVSGQGSTSVSVTGSGVAVSGDVCVLAQNSCGASIKLCLTINASTTVGAIGSIVGSGSGLCGITKNYTVVNQIGVVYTWTVPAGTSILSGQGSYKIQVSFSSGFVSDDIKVIASSSCGNTQTAIKTVIGKPASPTAISGPLSICNNAQGVTYSCNTSAGATSYTWTKPAGTTIVSGQGTSSIVLNFAGTAGTVLALKVKAVNSCGTSSNRTVNINLNACPRQSENELSQMNLFPNPVRDELNISWNTETEDAQIITCLDILGQVVWQEQLKFSIGTSTYKIATDQFPSGVYFIRLQQGDKIRSRKFVVRR